MAYRMEKPEILAPAGDWDSFLAAVHHKADAVYVGGKAFGARAYAQNFDFDQLRQLVDYAHLFGCKVYYTLNTLIKDSEFDRLERELEQLIEIKIDSCIIQDWGVYHLIRQKYKQLNVHASTQMNLHSIADVNQVYQLGFSRVVLARECSLEDIKAVKQALPIEIEAFVHGALCYCYSGQCYMSSLYGGRSGNRGKCAQPCRLDYQIENQTAPFLSLKDQLSLWLLPELMAAGVDSFKIEGRMKSAGYVGYSTKVYRHYRDLAAAVIENPETTYEVKPEHIDKLKQLFNRGDFIDGYYQRHNGADMISYDLAKHQGVAIGSLKIKNSELIFRFQQSVAGDDLLEIRQARQTISFRLNQAVEDNQAYRCVGIYSKGRLLSSKDLKQTDYTVARIHSADFNEAIGQIESPKIPIRVEIEAKPGQCLRIGIQAVDSRIKVEQVFEMVETAKNRPTTKEEIAAKFNKLGDTVFEIVEWKIELAPEAFVPLKYINHSRRSVLAELEQALLAVYSKTQLGLADYLDERLNLSSSTVAVSQPKQCDFIGADEFCVLIGNRLQYQAVARFGQRPEVLDNLRYLYLNLATMSVQELSDILIQANNELNAGVFLALPPVVMQEKQSLLERKLNQIKQRISGQAEIDGLLIRTIGQLALAQAHHWEVHTDFNIHCFNRPALAQLQQMGVDKSVLSVELNHKSMEALIQADVEATVCQVVGRIPLMISANCLYQSRYRRCDKQSVGHQLTITDRKAEQHKVHCNCAFCYNTVYNSHRLNLLNYWHRIKATKKIDFTDESAEEVVQIMNDIQRVIRRQPITAQQETDTKGHYLRGVK